jgi:hypothetical protein
MQQRGLPPLYATVPIFSLVWLSDDPDKTSTLLGFGLFYFFSLIIFLIYIHSTRGQKYDKGSSSKKISQNQKTLKNYGKNKSQ